MEDCQRPGEICQADASGNIFGFGILVNSARFRTSTCLKVVDGRRTMSGWNMSRAMATLFLLLLLALPTRAEVVSAREFLKLPNTDKKIEFYWSKPEGHGPWPVLLLIHPSQGW